MKIIKIEKKENESLAWEAVAVIAALFNIALLFVITFLALKRPDPRTIGYLASANLVALAILFIALKKGVINPERVYVKI
jgi:hypothetical protein